MDLKLAKLRQQLATFQRRREEARRTMEEVKALLAKADVRHREEPNNKRKWDQVLNNLEFSLAEAKSRVQHFDTEIARVEGQLRNAESPHATNTPPQNPQEYSGEPLGQAERELLEASMEALSQFSLEQLGLAHSHLSQRAKNHLKADHLLGRVELANQKREDAQASAPEKLRNQIFLRAAVDKLQAGHVEQMTAEEIQLLVSCHSLLTRRLNPSEKDKRLIQILDKAMVALKKRSTELRQTRQ